jgi:diguanylate cyclase (GGDEF)-like protein
LLGVLSRPGAPAAANSRLHALAVTDALTGAYNRRHFNTYLELLLARDDRREPVALCLFDLDRFKRYNDRHGHPAGDAVLQQIAATVQAMLQRSGDALFRLGGEEFGVLFSARSPGGAHAFVDELRRAIVALEVAHPDNDPPVVTASFGVCWIRRDGGVPNPARIYRLADEQLYAAKDAGRNQVCLTTEAIEAMPATS